MKLKSKQLRFIEEYLVDLNATQAAIRAGYSARTANRIGSENLSKPDIAAAIQVEMDKRSKRVGITADRVLSEIACLAFYDPADFKDVHSPGDIANLPEDARRAIIGWGWNKEFNFVLKLSPKTPSLDQLGRHLKLFTDRIDLSSNVGLAERIKAARERTSKRPDRSG